MAQVSIERYPDKIKGKLNFNILESVTLDYDISWDSISVYGRQDPIQSYKTTGQTISITVAKTFTSVKKFKTLLRALNQFARPIYEGNNIARAPLWKITLLKNNGYVESPLIIAPNSLNVDYGDRLRKIAAIRGSSVGGLTDNVFGKLGTFPKRVSVSFGGAVINTTRQYTLLDSAALTPGPVAPATDPQTIAIVGTVTTNRRGEQVLEPVRTVAGGPVQSDD